MTTTDQAAASPIPLKLAGETWMMAPMDAKDTADFVRFCRAAYVQHWKVSTQGMAQALIDAKVCEAIEKSSHFSSSSPEVLERMCDLDGLCFMLFLCLRKNHPDITVEKAQELICDPQSLVPDPALMHYALDHIQLLQHLDTPQETGKKAVPLNRGAPKKRKTVLKKRKKTIRRSTASLQRSTRGGRKKLAR